MLTTAISLLAGCLLLGQAPAESADDSPTKKPAAKAEPAAAPDELAPVVTRLIRQLDAPEKAKRDGAEADLLKLGTRALPLLPEPAADGGAVTEVKLRIGRVRAALEKLRADEQVGASRISLKGPSISLEEMIEAFEKQTGNKLIDHREQFGQELEAKALQLDFDKATFWPSLDLALDAAGMTIYPSTGEPELALVNRSDSQLPRYKRGFYAGAFRIELTEITARRDLRDPQGDSLRIMLEAAWEPRLTPIVLSQPGDALSIVGDDDKALAVNPESELEVSINPGDTVATIPLVVPLPPRTVTSIAKLRGSLSVLLPGPIETFRFEKLQAASKGEQRRAGVKVMLDQVRQNNLVWEVRMRLVFDNPGKALESHRTWVLHNEAFLLNAAGERVSNVGFETTRQAENEVGVAYLFDIGDVAGHTFVYKTPAAIIPASVEYELKDIKLP
ncbi:MAG TPA: hypothetical protein VGJ26_00645 [Pirellulales bacterium]|jgi:hypothetical protein